MKIAHVSDCYLPRTGGIETQVRALALHQVAAGDDIRILTATPGERVHSGRDEVDGIPVDRIAMRLPFDLPVHIRTRREVVTALRGSGLDAIHVHAGVVSPFAWGAVRAARELRLPCLITVHSVWGPLARPGFGASDALTTWTSWGAQLSAVSAVAARAIERAVPKAGPVMVTPNGIETADWRVAHVAGEPGTLRAVTVMRLAPRKRILPLLRIVEMVHRSLLDSARLHLTVIGDGPERGQAERYVERHGLQSVVTFAGRLDRHGIRAAFAQADVFVQPSIKESFGLAALEARSAGLPVIARRETGTTEFIRDGVEGLIASSDPDMARALLRLVRDPVLVGRLRAHNEAHDPDQTWTHALEAVHNGYVAAADRARQLG